MVSQIMNKLGIENKQAKFITRIIRIILLVLLGVLLLCNSCYTVAEQQQAIILTFGKPTSVKTAGFGMKLPFIQDVKKVKTTIIGVPIGYREDNPQQDVTNESLMITKDYNFLNVSFYMEVQVIDPIAAKYGAENVVEIAKAIGQSSIRSIIGQYMVDDVLTTSKATIESEIKDVAREEMEKLNLGLRLVNMTMQDVEPPTMDVVNAFKAVENAKQTKETALNEAHEYENKQLPNARAKADKIIKDANAVKQQRINEANGQVERFNTMFAEYIKNPEVTKKRYYYEMLEQVLPNINIIYDGTDGQLNSFMSIPTYEEFMKQTAESKVTSQAKAQEQGGN